MDAQHTSQTHSPKNTLLSSNITNMAMGFVQEKLDAQHSSRDAHQKFEKNSMHKDPTSIQRGARCPRFQPREPGRTLCVPRTHSFGNMSFLLSLGLDALCFVWGELDAHCTSLGRTHGGLSGGHRGLDEKEPILAMIPLLFPLMLLAVPRMISCGKARCYRTPKN